MSKFLCIKEDIKIRFLAAILNTKLKDSKKTLYSISIILLLLGFIVMGKSINLIGPNSLLSPLAHAKTTDQVFAFAPSLAQNKFDSIDFKNLSYLAFYDAPVSDTGDIVDGRGYESFFSDNAAALFQKAHDSGTKVLLTLSMNYNPDIATLLDSTDAQRNLAKQAADVIKSSNTDGVTIDFEYDGNWGPTYKEKFSKFLSVFVIEVHKLAPGSIVSVAVGSDSASKENFDLSSVASSSDKVFLIASDMVVSEENGGNPSNPTFGYSANNYWNDVSSKLSSFGRQVGADKLTYERAWYGNGSNYPLYLPSAKPDTSVNVEAKTKLDKSTTQKLISGVPDDAKTAAAKNLPYITQALKDEGILNPQVLSYAMATIEHETAGTFEPLGEYGGRQSARRLGYEGGEDYYGRGFIQLTHLRNYKIMGERIGMGDKLAKNPDLASDPKVAAKILAAFFKDNNVATLASAGDFIDARAPINPDANGYTVAMLAYKYEDSF